MSDNIESMRNPLKIAVIDSGIDPTVSNLGQYIVKSTGFRVNEEGIIVEDDNMEVRHLHGTVISLIIRQLCKNIQLTSINILNERLATDGRILLHAIEKAISYKPDIIHLSLGTTRWRYILQMKKLVREASVNNILIVSALSNEGVRSYPACLKGVVGVKADRDAKFATLGFENSYFYAPFRADGIIGIDEAKERVCVAGTSISAAYITGYFASEMYSRNINEVDRIIAHMKSVSLNNVIRGGDNDEYGRN